MASSDGNKNTEPWGGFDDNIIQVTGTYSCKRMTARWPMVVFNIIDVSVYNRFVMWMEVNPGEFLQEDTIPRRVGESHGGTPHSKAPTSSSNTILCWIGERYTEIRSKISVCQGQKRQKEKGAICVQQELSKQALCAVNAVHIFARHMHQPPRIGQHVHESTQNGTTIDC